MNGKLDLKTFISTKRLTVSVNSFNFAATKFSVFKVQNTINQFNLISLVFSSSKYKTLSK